MKIEKLIHTGQSCIMCLKNSATYIIKIDSENYTYICDQCFDGFKKLEKPKNKVKKYKVSITIEHDLCEVILETLDYYTEKEAKIIFSENLIHKGYSIIPQSQIEVDE